jgi:DNA-binding CsgD family transcriptional regulator
VKIVKHPKIIAYFAFTSFLSGDLAEFARWADQLADKKQVVNKQTQTMSHFITLLDPRNCILETLASRKKEAAYPASRLEPVGSFWSFSFNGLFFHKALIDFSFAASKSSDFLGTYRRPLSALWKSAAPLLEDLIEAGFYFEKRQLDTALSYACFAKNRINDKTPSEAVVCTYMMLAEIYDNLYKKEEYIAATKAAEDYILSNGLYYLLPNFRAVVASKLILYGNKNALCGWLEKTAPKLPAEVNFYTYEQHLVTTRCLTATARFKEALIILQKMAAFCTDFNRTIDLLQTKILLSINYWNLDSKCTAIELMKEVLLIAQEYDYITIFSREAHDILPILKKIVNKISRGKSPEIDKPHIKSVLLHINNIIQASNTVGMTSLSGIKPKRLSKQQTLMLMYLSQGMTYMEICEKTGLKITSVREHITKLYDKLSVHNSTDMLKRAQELNLL